VAAGAARPRVAARDMIDEMPESQASATEIGVAEFMSQLDSTHTQGLDDLHFGDGDSYGYAKAQEEKAEEVLTEVAAPKDKVKLKSKRSANYSEEEDVALCHAWMNVSLDASVGTDQCKDKFWQKKN
jgi:hypothetical protein